MKQPSCTVSVHFQDVNYNHELLYQKITYECRIFLLCVSLVWIANSFEHMFSAQLALLVCVSCPCCLWLCFLSTHSQAVISPATQPCQTHSQFIRCSFLQLTQSSPAAALFDIILTYSPHFLLIFCILVSFHWLFIYFLFFAFMLW